jgi:group I intron endonuclease
MEVSENSITWGVIVVPACLSGMLKCDMKNIAQKKRHRCGFALVGDITGRLVVYKLTNTVNGKSYIGISTRGLWRRLSTHAQGCDGAGLQYAIYAAFRKYGKEAFSAEVLARAETLDELLALECALIAEHGTYDKGCGYNETLGGQGTLGHFHSAETIAKIMAKSHSPESSASRSAKLKGRKNWWSAGENSPMHRFEVKQKIIEAATGRPNPGTAERNKSARRLTEDQVRAILLDPRMLHEIGADYGLSPTHIGNIMAGRRYSEWVAKARAEFGDLIDARMQVARHRSYPQRGGDNHPFRRKPELARRVGEKLKGRKAPETSEANKQRRSLTEDDIRVILTDPRTGVELAEFFGKSTPLIYAIRAGRKYADVVQRIRAEIESSESDQYQIAVGDNHG